MRSRSNKNSKRKSRGGGLMPSLFLYIHAKKGKGGGVRAGIEKINKLIKDIRGENSYYPWYYVRGILCDMYIRE